jgi:hypothetical protein
VPDSLFPCCATARCPPLSLSVEGIQDFKMIVSYADSLILSFCLSLITPFYMAVSHRRFVGNVRSRSCGRRQDDRSIDHQLAIDRSPAREASPSPALEASPSPALEASPSPALEASPSPALDASPSPALEASPSPAPIPEPEVCSQCDLGLDAVYKCPACDTGLDLFCSKECFDAAHKREKDPNHSLKELNPTYPTCGGFSLFQSCEGDELKFHCVNCKFDGCSNCMESLHACQANSSNHTVVDWIEKPEDASFEDCDFED